MLKGMKKWFLGLFLVGIVVSFVFLPALFAGNVEMAAKPPQIVYVHLNGDQIEYEPEIIYLKRNESVIFQCIDGHTFSIDFGYNSAFGKKSFQALRGDKILVKVPKNAPYGKYKYTIAIFDGEKVWIEDPSIIIQWG